MSHMFYRAFEDKYRGSRDVIKSRLRFYLPFVEPIRDHFQNDAPVMDLGCGRGEWIELLSEAGFQPSGVDLDDGMLAACEEKGLSVKKEDALTALQKLADNSQAIISAFHLVEHIDFATLQLLIEEGYRALRPGGLLILETPNPENIVVGATSFYRDPTHHRPLPPELLAFLPEFVGFQRTKIIRLQEDPSLHENKAISLYSVFHGPSPDYAIIAQKAAQNTKFNQLDALFAQDFGITLGSLADRYHIKLEERLNHALDVAEHGHNVAKQADYVAHEALKTLNDLTQKTNEVFHIVDVIRTEMKGRAEAAEKRILDLEESFSWRVTKPIRWVSYNLRRAHLHARHAVKQRLLVAIPVLARVPWIKRPARYVLRNSPGATNWIRRFMATQTSPANTSHSLSSTQSQDPEVMTPSARRIAHHLQQILKNKDSKN